MTSYSFNDRPLALLQNWLRVAITSPHGLSAGLAQAEHRYGIERELAVKASDPAEAPERLAIYARGYVARLLEYLRADYPATHAFLGDDLFTRFAIDYLWSRPPHHYSLFTVGAQFVDHLERTRPANDMVQEAERSWLQLPIDLARVERARMQALRAPGLEDKVAAPATSDPWKLLLPANGIVITAAPCMYLVAVARDVSDFIAAVDAGSTPAPPPIGSTVLAVSRHRFRPTLTPLTVWQVAVLEHCQQPQRLTLVVTSVAQTLEVDPETLRVDLALWLPLAQSSGLVTLQQDDTPRC